jgi:tetratricopeptide (TPR) repeat protein
MRPIAIASLALLLLACPRSARADEAEQTARAHYDAGKGLFHLGRYHDAAVEFAAGYELYPRPEFLLNLGQTYRKLNRLAEARVMFERFLAEAPPEHPERPGVVELLKTLPDEAIVAPDSSLPVVEPRAKRPPERPTVKETARESPPRKRTAVVALLVVAAVVVVAGVALGVGVAASGASSDAMGPMGNLMALHYPGR